MQILLRNGRDIGKEVSDIDCGRIRDGYQTAISKYVLAAR